MFLIKKYLNDASLENSSIELIVAMEARGHIKKKEEKKR